MSVDMSIRKMPTAADMELMLKVADRLVAAGGENDPVVKDIGDIFGEYVRQFRKPKDA